MKAEILIEKEKGRDLAAMSMRCHLTGREGMIGTREKKRREEENMMTFILTSKSQGQINPTMMCFGMDSNG